MIESAVLYAAALGDWVNVDHTIGSRDIFSVTECRLR
jgi:hypothetical protein